MQQTDVPQVQDYIHLQTASNWLVTINAARVAEPVRDSWSIYSSTFATRSGGPSPSSPGCRPSSAIEDLDDLRQIDPGLRALAEIAGRQQAIEKSQDRAQTAWRDITDQVRAGYAPGRGHAH